MADYSELKKLAEGAPEGPWFGPEYAPGASYVFDVDLGTLLHYESIESEQDACLRYVAAANPAAVLALIAENDGLKTGYEAYEQVNAGLKAEVEALRKSAPSKEVVWCSCGDGYAANSYGAGFMDANDGVCANCDASMGKGEQS